MKKKILIIGTGGHAKSITNIVNDIKKFQIIGYIAKNKKEYFNSNLKVIGTEKNLNSLRKKKINTAIIGVGQIHSSKTRRDIFKRLKKLGFQLPVIISKNANVSKKSIIGLGTCVFSNVFINTDVKIGENCIINTGAIIEHDVEIGDNCHVSTGVIINGGVKIGSNVFIGSGSIVSNNISIPKNSFIKMGTCIKK